MRLFFVLLLSFFVSVSSYGSGKVDLDLQNYKKGLFQYEIGSYSTALDYFFKLLKPNSPYYKEALFMLAKTYYAIGKKTGMKGFLWQALNYLELYFIEYGNRELPWKYYYTRAQIYESLSFYEQALALYRVAFLRAKTPQEKLETTIGIVRCAVWVKRPDIVDQYFILISTSNLTAKEKEKVNFVKGLVLFSLGKYKEALPYFMELYRRYENYLIDNPNYYLLVAEDIYRLGNYTLAEQLFRRIASLTKDPEVIRKATLRLGDIEVKKKNYALAFVYYYSLISGYPNSMEATVAKLKVIPLLDIPKVRYRALLSKEEAFKDPIKFTASILVNYRTTYVGIYALADLGYFVFKLGSPENVFKRLTWELSLVFPEDLKYEQREFLVKLWTPYLLKLPSNKACSLYKSNPSFFEELFSKEVLLKFVNDLKSCNLRRLRVELLSYMVKRWKDDKDRLLMAQALFENKDFANALKVLEKVKNKDSCKYLLLKGELSIFLPIKGFPFDKFSKKCLNPKSGALVVYYLAKNGNIESAFNYFKEFKRELLKSYSRELVVKGALNKLLEISAYYGRYDITKAVASSLVGAGYGDCLTESYLLLSLSHLGEVDKAKEVFKKVSACLDSLSVLAKSVYQNTLLEREVVNGSF